MKRTYYVLAVRKTWASMKVFDLLPVTTDSRANGFLLVYDSLDDLHADWPGANYFTIEAGD